MAKTYKITNYGNTRKLPYKGMYYELTKNCSITTEDKKLADALGEFQFIDVAVIEQPDAETVKQPKKKKAVKKKRK